MSIRMHHLARKYKKNPGGACPQTPLAVGGLGTSLCPIRLPLLKFLATALLRWYFSMPKSYIYIHLPDIGIKWLMNGSVVCFNEQFGGVFRVYASKHHRWLITTYFDARVASSFIKLICPKTLSLSLDLTIPRRRYGSINMKHQAVQI